jgi:hypothetical protein
MKFIHYWPLTHLGSFRNSISMLTFTHLFKTEVVIEKNEDDLWA